MGEADRLGDPSIQNFRSTNRGCRY